MLVHYQNYTYRESQVWLVVAVKRRVHTWGGGRGERRGPKRGPRTLRKVEEEPEAPAILLCCDSTTRPCGSRPANRGLYSNSWGVLNKSPGRDHRRHHKKDGKAEAPVVGGRGIIRRGRGSDRTTGVVTPARIGGHGRPEGSRGRSRNGPERGFFRLAILPTLSSMLFTVGSVGLIRDPQLLLCNLSDSLAGFLRVGRRIATKRRMVGRGLRPLHGEVRTPPLRGPLFGAPSSCPGRHPMYVVYSSFVRYYHPSSNRNKSMNSLFFF